MDLARNVAPLRIADRVFERAPFAGKSLLNEFESDRLRRPSIRLMRRGKIAGTVAQEFFASDTVELRGVFIAIDESSFIDVANDDRFRGVLDKDPVMLFALAQRFRSALLGPAKGSLVFRAMQRQGQAADLLLQYVVGDAHFDAVHGHLIAQRPREENQGNLG